VIEGVVTSAGLAPPDRRLLCETTGMDSGPPVAVADLPASFFSHPPESMPRSCGWCGAFFRRPDGGLQPPAQRVAKRMQTTIIARHMRGKIHPYADPSANAQSMTCSPFVSHGAAFNFFDERGGANVTDAAARRSR